MLRLKCGCEAGKYGRRCRHLVLAIQYDDWRRRQQFVTLVRGGEAVKMSTRRATYVTLDEVIDEVGADAVRYFMFSRSSDSQFEFDLNLARE